MTANITNNTLIGPCINITAQNVTLNCNGFYILSDDSVSGVYSNQLNTTIKNCNITMGSGAGGYGVYLDETSNSNIFNNNLNNNNIGIALENSSNNNLSANIANNNSLAGFYITSYSNNNTLTNNTIISISGIAIRISSYSNNNVLINNTATSNSNSGIYILSSNNNTLINNTIARTSHKLYFFSFFNSVPK